MTVAHRRRGALRALAVLLSLALLSAVRPVRAGICTPSTALRAAMEKAEQHFAVGEVNASLDVLDDALRGTKPEDPRTVRPRLARLEALFAEGRVYPQSEAADVIAWLKGLFAAEGRVYPQSEAADVIARAQVCDAETRALATAESVRLAFVKLVRQGSGKVDDAALAPVLKQVEQLEKQKPRPSRALGTALVLAGRLVSRAGAHDRALAMGLRAVAEWEDLAPEGHYARWHAAACALLSMAAIAETSYHPALVDRLTRTLPAWARSGEAPPPGVTEEVRGYLHQMAFLRGALANDRDSVHRLMPLLVASLQPKIPLDTPFAQTLCWRLVEAANAADHTGAPFGYEHLGYGVLGCMEYMARLNIRGAQLSAERRIKLDSSSPNAAKHAELLHEMEVIWWDMAARELGVMVLDAASSLDVRTMDHADSTLQELAAAMPAADRPLLSRYWLLARLEDAVTRTDCQTAWAIMSAIERYHAELFGTADRIRADPFERLYESGRLGYIIGCGSLASLSELRLLSDGVQLNTYGSETLSDPHPRYRHVPPGGELAQLTHEARWGFEAANAGAMEQASDALLWSIRHPRFRDLSGGLSFRTCAAYHRLPDTFKKPEQVDHVKATCGALLADPTRWPHFYGATELAGALVGVEEPRQFVTAYARIAGKRSQSLADFISISPVHFTEPTTTMDAIMYGLERAPGSIDGRVAEALGTIALHVGGLEDDFIRARLRARTHAAASSPDLQQKIAALAALDAELATVLRDPVVKDGKERIQKITARRVEVQMAYFRALSVSSWLRVPEQAVFGQLCRPNAHSVAFFEARGRLHAVVLAPDCSARYVGLGDLASLQEPVTRAAQMSNDEAWKPGVVSKEAILAAASDLRARLWTPLGIPPGGTIAIADTPLTARVSFAAIQGRDPGTFLAEEHVFVRAHALRDLWPQEGREAPGDQTLTVGGIPVPGASVLQPDEGIRRAFSDTKTLSGDQATFAGIRNALANRRVRLLSLNAHGKYDDRAAPGTFAGQPLREGLWTQTKVQLAGALASALELLSLPLQHTEVVLLGACESGVGPAGADGLSTLRQALRLAGAETVVSSIGVVNDAAARAVTEGFWRAIAEGQPPALALSSAQRGRLRALRASKDGRWYSPALWSVFELATSLPPPRAPTR